MSTNNRKTVSTCQARAVPAGGDNADYMRSTTAVDDQFILHPDDAKSRTVAAFASSLSAEPQTVAAWACQCGKASALAAQAQQSNQRWTAALTTIGKLAAGYRPGDDGWSDIDQGLLEEANSAYSMRGIAPAFQEQQDAAKANAGRMAVILAALESAQNQIGGGRPDGSSDPNSDDYDCDADLWDYFQRAIDAAKEISV